jgi:two-component system sensor histidine kinase and response regulator WspE
MMGRKETSKAAHLLEDLLGEVIQGLRPADAPLLRKVRLAVDLLERLIDRPDQAKEIEIALLTLLGDRGGEGPESLTATAERRRSGADRRRDTSTFLRLSLQGLGQLERMVRVARRATAEAHAGLRTCAAAAADLEAISGAALDRAGADPDPARARDVAHEAVRLVGAAGGLSRLADDLGRELARLERETGRTDALLGELRSTRASWIFDRLAAAAEELSQRAGRQLAIERSGEDVPVERHLATWVLEQLVQLVRNAVAHGLEEPAQRIALGKSPSGRLSLEARSAAGWLHLAVADDGQGIDLEGVRRRAVEMGLVAEDVARRATDDEALDWIFLPGVSTRPKADQIAGRGVGLDAVRAVVAQRGGSVTVWTRHGQGTRFELHVPSAAEPCRALIVTVSGVPLAVPMADVRDFSAPPPAPAAGRPAEVLSVARVLGLAPATGGAARPAHVAIDGARLEVGSIEGVTDVTVHTLRGRLASFGPYLGVGQRLDDDRQVLVLDPRRLASSEDEHSHATPTERARVLLVEDSPTVRKLLSRALAAAGFVVDEAAHGLDAWARLGPFLSGSNEDARPDVVVTDLEMPHLDGFELVRRIRAAAPISGLPVVVVTSKDTEEGRRLLAKLGVSSVVSKRSGDAELIRAVREAAGDGGGNQSGSRSDN